MCIRSHKQRAIQVSILVTVQEVPPGIGGFFRIYVEPQNLTVAIAVGTFMVPAGTDGRETREPDPEH